MPSFKPGDYVIPNKEGAEYSSIYKINSISKSSGLDCIEIYKVTTIYNSHTKEKSISYIDNHFRLLTRAEEILYVK